MQAQLRPHSHIHQAAIHDNHDPDNTGLVLWVDFIQPLVAIGPLTYCASSEANRGSFDDDQR